MTFLQPQLRATYNSYHLTKRSAFTCMHGVPGWPTVTSKACGELLLQCMPRIPLRQPEAVAHLPPTPKGWVVFCHSTVGKYPPHNVTPPLWLKVHAMCWMAGEKQGAARSAKHAPTGGAWYEEDAAALLPAAAAREVSEEEVEAARVRADAALAAEVAAFGRDKGAAGSAAAGPSL